MAIHPAETVGIEVAPLVVEADKTLAEVALESVLDGVNALLRPSCMHSGLCTLSTRSKKGDA